MATSAANLVQRTRRFMRDWPDQDTISASLSSTATTITITGLGTYAKNYPIEIDSETMLCRGAASGASVTVERGAFGSTAATHTSGSTVLIRPGFFAAEILDALNAAIQACYPRIYQEVLDTTLTVTNGTYEYTIPNMPGTFGGDTLPIPRLRTVEIQDASTVPYTTLRSWNVRRGATPKLKLTYLEAAGAVLRLRGYGPFPDLALTDSLHAQWPKNFVQPLVEMAGSMLSASGEAGRSRMDVGARDDREAANKPGAAMAVANSLESRFLRRLSSVAVPPMQPHIVTHE